MSYPGWGFLVVLGVAIGSAIYYYFNNENNHHRYEYPHEGSRGGRGFRANVSDENCTICLETLNGFRKLRGLSCGHVFHDHCIAMWLNQKRLCPICRITI